MKKWCKEDTSTLKHWLDIYIHMERHIYALNHSSNKLSFITVFRNRDRALNSTNFRISSKHTLSVSHFWHSFPRTLFFSSLLSSLFHSNNRDHRGLINTTTKRWLPYSESQLPSGSHLSFCHLSIHQQPWFLLIKKMWNVHCLWNTSQRHSV